MAFGIGSRLKKEFKRPEKALKSAGRSIDQEITQPLFGSIASQPSAARDVTPTDAEDAASAAEALRISDLAKETRKRGALRPRGRKSTILAGSNPDLVNQSRTPRKTLLGG